jgi:glycosyltransferase involved in cell wall biosynthesis
MVPVKNEEFTIEEKIKNIFELDYPKEKLQILIMDSSSDDKTQSIVSKYFDK